MLVFELEYIFFYGLSIEEGMIFECWVWSGCIVELDFDLVVDMYEWVIDEFVIVGFE